MKLASLYDLETFGEYANFNRQLLLQHLDGTSLRLQKILNRNLEYATAIEYFTSNFTRYFYVKQYPIDIAQTVTVSVNTLGSFDVKTENEDYWVYPEEGLIQFKGIIQSYQPKNVKVEFTGGYQEISINTTPVTRLNNTMYNVNDRISVTNILTGRIQVFRCTIAGISDVAEPTWNYGVATTTVDGAATWTEDSGYEGVLDVPFDLRNATLTQINYDVRKRKYKGVSSGTTPDGSQSFSEYRGKILPSVMQVLREYRRIPQDR